VTVAAPMSFLALADWAVAGRALPGEPDSGDLHVVVPLPDGALVAVIDALGHGPEAAAAARIAAETLQAYAHEPVSALVHRCHQRLRPTRGAVMSVVSFSAPFATLTWLGIGNVEGYLVPAETGVRRRESILTRGGVIGFQLPGLKPTTVPVAPGDTLVLATDGIGNAFIEAPVRHGSAQAAADCVLREYGKATDDALVLVARFAGGAP